MIDLHVHSTKSDGTFTPSQLVDYAVAKHLTAFALTDHDTVDGLQEAMDAAVDRPVTVIPGIEFSTVYEHRDVHVVGLFLAFQKEAFQTRLQEFLHSREVRNEKMCQKLRDIAHIDITYEKLRSQFPNAVITRAHYGRYLLEHGYVGSINEAFDRYLGEHASCFVPREKVTPIDAIEMIHGSGGLAILAHPTLYHMSDHRLEGLVALLARHGLDGIETYYSTYTAGEQRHMTDLASRYGLAPSGGSDFHGANKPSIDLGSGKGYLEIPDRILDALEVRRRSNHSACHPILHQ